MQEPVKGLASEWEFTAPDCSHLLVKQLVYSYNKYLETVTNNNVKQYKYIINNTHGTYFRTQPGLVVRFKSLQCSLALLIFFY